MLDQWDLFLQRIERTVLWATTFAFPIIVLPGITQDEFKIPKMALLVLGTGVAGTIHLFRSGLRTAEHPDRRILAVGGILLAGMSISWLFSDVKQWALVGQYYRYQGLLPYFLFVGYGVLLAAAFKGRGRSIGWALALSASVTGTYSIIQAFHLDPLFPVASGQRFQHAFSFIGNSNFAGAWHAIALPIALGLLIDETGRRRDVVSLMIGPIVAGLLFSFSETAWVAAFGGTAAFAGMHLGRSRPPLRTAGFALAGAAGIGLILIVTSVALSEKAAQAFGPTIEVRADGWQAAIDSWSDSPVTGRGPNTFALFGYRYSSIEEQITAIEYLDDPHSVPLSFLGSSGLVGAAGYVLALSGALWYCTRTAVRSQNAILMGLAAGVITYGVQALVSIDDPALRLGFWAAFAGVLAGVPLLGDRGETDPATVRPLRLGALVLATITLLGLSISWSWRVLEADKQIRDGVEAVLDNQPNVARRAFSRATGLRDDYWYRFLAGKGVGELASRHAPEAEDLFREMQQHFASIEVPRHPRDLYIEGALTSAWAAKADPSFMDRGISLLEQAHRLNPGRPTYAIGLAELLIHTGESHRAVAILEPYLPHAFGSRFWGTWALANASSGNQQEAWNTIRGMELDVQDPNVRNALELLID